MIGWTAVNARVIPVREEEGERREGEREGRGGREGEERGGRGGGG